MSLLAIKNYLRTTHKVSFFDLRKQFNVQPLLLQDMLNILVQKGKVRKTLKTEQCGSKCSKCNVAVTEMYEWLNKEEKI